MRYPVPTSGGSSVSLGNEILGVVTRGLLRAIDGRGLDRAALLREAGLTEESLEPDRWIPISQHVRLGGLISAALPGQNLGLQTGAPIFSDPKGALGYVLRQSQTHSRALLNFAAYVQTVNRSIRVLVSREARGTALRLEMVPQMEMAGHPAEALFAAWVSISRYLTGSSWCPLEVAFVHRPFGDPAEHQMLFGCPASFERDETRLLLSERDASLPIREAPHEFGDVVRAAVVPANTLLQQDQAARARLAELAERLLTAPLEVRAKAAGADPERLSARLALAHALLQGSGVLAYEATYLLGFESLNAFERAFFERFQLLPSQVRSPT
jgi:hypothetical protein